MYKQWMIAGALLLATGQALAHGYHYGHRGSAVVVEPSVTFSFGGRHHDGVGITYSSGGRYWYDAPRYPVTVIGAPVYGYRHYSPPRAYHRHHHHHRHHDRGHRGHRGHRH